VTVYGDGFDQDCELCGAVLESQEESYPCEECGKVVCGGCVGGPTDNLCEECAR